MVLHGVSVFLFQCWTRDVRADLSEALTNNSVSGKMRQLDSNGNLKGFHVNKCLIYKCYRLWEGEMEPAAARNGDRN